MPIWQEQRGVRVTHPALFLARGYAAVSRTRGGVGRPTPIWGDPRRSGGWLVMLRSPQPVMVRSPGLVMVRSPDRTMGPTAGLPNSKGGDLWSNARRGRATRADLGDGFFPYSHPSLSPSSLLSLSAFLQMGWSHTCDCRTIRPPGLKFFRRGVAAGVG